jgi:hypothetical protein
MPVAHSNHRRWRSAPRLVLWTVTATMALGAGLVGSYTATGAPTPLPAKATAHRYGVAFGGVLYGMDKATLDATLAGVAATGATWIREQIPWSGLEETQGVKNWPPFDRVVASAKAHNLQLNVLLGGSPLWARPRSCPTAGCAPSDNQQFAAYASAVASRYKGSVVRSYEIWNEPNILPFWHQGANPTTYAALLRATAAAVRKADPAALLISGGLAPASTGNGNMDPRDFVAGLCKEKVLGLVDAVGFHPYSFPAPPTHDATWNAWSQMGTTTRNIRSLMSGCGVNKPIWATEYGAPTDGPGTAVGADSWQSAPATADHVTELYQANLIQTAVQLTAKSSWLEAIFVYTAQDRGNTRTTRENYFGMRRYSGSAKPAWSAFSKAVTAARQESGR